MNRLESFSEALPVSVTALEMVKVTAVGQRVSDCTKVNHDGPEAKCLIYKEWWGEYPTTRSAQNLEAIAVTI